MGYDINTYIYPKQEFLDKVAEINNFNEEQKELHKKLVDEYFTSTLDDEWLILQNAEYFEDQNPYFGYVAVFEKIFTDECDNGLCNDAIIPYQDCDDKFKEEYDVYEAVTGKDDYYDDDDDDEDDDDEDGSGEDGSEEDEDE